jgi:hypothetical protein
MMLEGQRRVMATIKKEFEVLRWNTRVRESNNPDVQAGIDIRKEERDIRWAINPCC